MSEREYHDTGPRAIIVNEIMREILIPGGWIFLPILEMSSPRMRDSTNVKDNVIDGMHMSENLMFEISRVAFNMMCNQ